MTKDTTYHEKKVLTPVRDTIIVSKWEDMSRLGPTQWKGGETGGSYYGKKVGGKRRKNIESVRTRRFGYFFAGRKSNIQGLPIAKPPPITYTTYY